MAQSQWTANGTADATGAVTITFPTIAVNSEWTGNISVPQAPATAQWLVYVNDVAVSSLGGDASYGPLQIHNGDVLQLVGTRLTAGVQYQGVLVGQLVYGQTPAQIPVPTSSSWSAPVTRRSAPVSVIPNASYQGTPQRSSSVACRAGGCWCMVRALRA